MTAPGPECVVTPIAGLVESALRAPTLQRLIGLAADRPDELTLVGPASARLFVASALAQHGPLLVVTATGREADDLSAELRGVFGDSVAMFPSWETLPHERLSPGVDTVGARLMLLRRLAHPDDARLGPPLRVVVTAVRSLLQPMAPQLGLLEPLTLTVGSDTGSATGADGGFEGVITRLVELAYTRVD
ncbi:MAG: transcription-repair coupling factor, partial [Mycobacterium sp.]